MPFFDYFCIQKHNYYIMRRILYLCIFILSLLPIERLAAQRSITVYDPETNMPVRGFHIRTDKQRTDTTNIFGSVALPEKFDTLLLTKPGYIALRIPSKLVKDTIPVIKDYNNIGEVVVYGNRQNEFQEAVKRWAKADKTEMELRHPITGIEFNLSDILNADVMFYIPSREAEGYGMNNSAIDKLSAQGVKLIVTVDNGISAAVQIEYARSLGIDTVVTDHHMPPERLPNACAVVDPCRSDCSGSFKGLSGVGVAFKLIMALEGDDCDMDSLLQNYSDLLSIGTVADVMKLVGDNRVFVKRGLESIANSDRVGIRALIKHAGLEDRELSASSISLTSHPGSTPWADLAFRVILSGC